MKRKRADLNKIWTRFNDFIFRVDKWRTSLDLIWYYFTIIGCTVNLCKLFAKRCFLAKWKNLPRIRLRWGMYYSHVKIPPSTRLQNNDTLYSLFVLILSFCKTCCEFFFSFLWSSTGSSSLFRRFYRLLHPFSIRRTEDSNHKDSSRKFYESFLWTVLIQRKVRLP